VLCRNFSFRTIEVHNAGKLIEPARILRQPTPEDPAEVLGKTSLMISQVDIAALHPHDLDLATLVGHDESEPLARPVEHGLRTLYNAVSTFERHLEPALHALDRPALEEIVRIDSDANETTMELGQGIRVIVDPPEKDCLVEYDQTRTD
jgi:hypothetical protein